MTDKIVLTPEDRARHAFDAENNVEPCRTIAERIVHNYPHPDDLVDDISHAIEDARALGERRGAAEIERLHTDREAYRESNDRLAEMVSRKNAEIERLRAYNERLRAALESIAKNTCCDRCQEAALWAKAALKDTTPQP